MIYYVRLKGHWAIKIGTTGNVALRASQIAGEHEREVEVLGVHAGERTLERLLHTKFHKLRLTRSEWFKPSAELFDHIEKHSRPFNPLVGVAAEHPVWYFWFYGTRQTWIHEVARVAGVSVTEASEAAWKMYAESVGADPLPDDLVNPVERRYPPPDPPDEEEPDTNDEAASDPENESYQLVSEF